MLNSLSAIIFEIVSVICGLILPRLILKTFGSSYNGITSSITQFLSCVALLRSGIGGVTRAALYKPLAEKDTDKISGIYNATADFMRKVALIFAGSVLVFACIYPFALNDQFEWLFSSTLVLIIASSTFIDNYFGITNFMLLGADQRSYINNCLQIITVILNTIVAAILIRLGASIHLVKLGSAAVYFIRPIALNVYVQKHYKINKSIPKDKTAIAQRWDAFAHQIAQFVNNNTDVMVLTLFADIKLVSVYTVYHMVANGLYKVEKTFTEGMSAAFGNMLAKKENEVLQKNFRLFEYMVFTIATFLFTCGGILIVPFISVYTKGITDISYIQFAFGVLMCINQYLFCIRVPYQMMAEVAGHFKQTRNGAIMEAVINVIVSVLLVIKFGLIGVTVGTFCGLFFRTAQYSIYSSKNLLHRSLSVVIYRVLISCVQAILTVILCRIIVGSMSPETYMQWVLNAVVVALICFIVLIVTSFIFFRNESHDFVQKVVNTVLRKNKKK